MGRWGNFDFRKFEKLRDQIQLMGKASSEEFCRECARELAARLLRKVEQRTPVGKDNGGTLRRQWSIGEVRKQGDSYLIEVINPTEYASYVEYGHRSRSHNNWVSGRFMMTISEHEVQELAPALLERKLQKRLEEIFRDQ